MADNTQIDTNLQAPSINEVTVNDLNNISNTIETAVVPIVNEILNTQKEENKEIEDVKNIIDEIVNTTTVTSKNLQEVIDTLEVNKEEVENKEAKISEEEAKHLAEITKRTQDLYDKYHKILNIDITIANKFKDIYDKIKTNIITNLNPLHIRLLNIYDKIKENIDKVKTNINDQINNLKNKLELTFVPYINILKKSFVGRIFKKINDVLKGPLSKLNTSISKISSNISKTTKKIIGDIKKNIKKSFENFTKKIFKNLGPLAYLKFLLSPVGLTLLMILGAFIKVKIWPILKPIVDFIKDTWKNVLSPAIKWIWDVLKTSWENVFSPAIKWIWEGLKTSWEYWTKEFPIIWKNAKNMISNLWNKITKKIGSLFKDISKYISDKFSKFKKMIYNFIKTKVINPISKYIIKPLKKYVINPIRSLYSLIVDFYSKVMRGIGNIYIKLSEVSLLGKKPFDILAPVGAKYHKIADMIKSFSDYLKPNSDKAPDVESSSSSNSKISDSFSNNSNLKSTLNSYKSEEDKKELIEYINKSNAKSAEDINKVIAQFEGRRNLSIINNNNSKNSMIHVEPEPIRESMLGLSPSSSFVY